MTNFNAFAGFGTQRPNLVGDPQLPAGQSCVASKRAGARRCRCASKFFNLFNRANLGAPLAVRGAANFGTIITALDPRVVQLAVKVLF